MHVQEEILDIVNEQDQVVGSMPRSQAYAEKRMHQIRGIWLLIQNDKKQFLVMRRAYTKKVRPGWLDGSVVGHVSSGESYLQALHREALEELQIDLHNFEYTYLGKLTPTEHKSRSFFAIFHMPVSSSFVPKYTADEFAGHYWLTAQEIVDLDAKGEPMKDGLPLIIKTLYKDLLR